MALPLGFLGKFPGCRCEFRELDQNEECWARCDRRVESCEECHCGGNKKVERKPVKTKKKRRG